ncbi:MAG: hypothetical protein J6V60_00505 [Muribaculaceae bacterium]|jgi:predicted nuclease with TOPRIM domain|nr:hypothetical protein [Muribaculaceae bacterium]MBQ2370547.1 hypothetical protein [Muribaculaceae bacterium]MBQ5722890.1 hypothetical protein [Muribaculaceae bacterium]
MTTNLSELLQRLLRKSELLAERYSTLKAKSDDLQSRNEVLTEENSKLKAELEKMRIENEYLKVSHKIAPTAEDVKASQALITELVRNIDKCISQLNE